MTVTRSDVWRLGVLAAVWGGSFLFMRDAVNDIGPVMLVERSDWPWRPCCSCRRCSCATAVRPG
jgi:hypothetical protein